MAVSDPKPQEQAERYRQARELELAKQATENAQKATDAVKRAEFVERDRAIRFQREARRTALIAGLAMIGIIIAIIEAVNATNAQGQAVALVNEASTKIAAINATLTPVYQSLATATGAAFDNQIVLTLVPRVGGIAPTSIYLPNVEQKYGTATAVAAAYHRTLITTDVMGAALVQVPSGCFLMGDAAQGASPVTEICFEQPYWIDQYDVTNKAFAAFVAAGGYNDTLKSNVYWTDSGLQWRQGSNGKTVTTWGGDPNAPIPNPDCTKYSSEDNQPVVCVTWYEAYAYCAWRDSRLPTESEWEYAARGPASLVYPWGDTFVSGKDDDKDVYSGNSNGKTAKVGSKPKGVSWVGAYDMAGNVWQWVQSSYHNYPYSATDGRNDNELGNSDQYRVLRGGSFDFNNPILRSALRNFLDLPSHEYYEIGFRCARS